ncbi:hypothetical protein DUI87_09471 [Hirundo rustica rustica]|uniref:Integrase-type domain-containing protein n=1 Tax=Hirundo rustica rustica TaxID=333673 RepID=A0A3M0KMR5_HIRRU|nr:hypothetical protein DUI87_09471 [Hirundo rustica rustica]
MNSSITVVSVLVWNPKGFIFHSVAHREKYWLYGEAFTKGFGKEQVILILTKYYHTDMGKVLESSLWRLHFQVYISTKAGLRENCQLQLKAKPPVMVKDPATRETEGPHDLITWGRGYACVSTPSGPKWVPAKWVKPFIPKTAKPPAEAPQVASAAWRRRNRRTSSF